MKDLNEDDFNRKPVALIIVILLGFIGFFAATFGALCYCMSWLIKNGM
jgi:hypothetical protein